MPKKKEGQEVVEPERDKGTTAEKKEEPEEIEQEIKKEEDIASSSDDSSSPRTRDRKKSDDDRKARSTLKVTNLACKLKEKEDSVRMFLQSSGEEADGEKQESKKRRRRKNRSLRATKSNGNSHDEQEDNAVDPLQEDNAKVSVSPDSNHAVNTTRSSKIGLETRLKTSNSAAKNGEAGPQQVATPDLVCCRLLTLHRVAAIFFFFCNRVTASDVKLINSINEQKSKESSRERKHRQHEYYREVIREHCYDNKGRCSFPLLFPLPRIQIPLLIC